MTDAELYLDNFEFFRSERPGRLTDPHISTHGGVLVGVKSDFVPRKFDFETDLLGAISGCSFHIHGKNILLCSFYNPPLESDYHINQDTVTQLFTAVFNKEFDSFIVCGDFNIGEKDCDWSDYSSDDISIQFFLDLLVRKDIVQIVDFKTAASGILDIVLISKNLDYLSCEKANDQINNLSNHFGVVSCVEFKSNLTYLRENRFENKLSYCKGDYDSLNEIIRNEKFFSFCWSNVDVVVDQWYQWVNEKIKAYIPRRTAHRSRLSPWIKPRTSNIIKKLENALAKTPKNWRRCNYLQNLCLEMCEQDQIEYESNLADTRSTDALFRFYRSLKKSKIPSSVHLKNEYANDPTTQAELFSRYFASIFITSRCRTILPRTALVDMIDDFDISESTIVEICQKLVIKKATGPDGIPSIFYKKSASTIAKSLSQLFYKIKQTSTFPETWKQSHVTPVYKKGSRSDIENYRPVSILTIASKILERCIFIPLYQHLEPSFSCYQYGFRKKRSSIIQLIVYLEKVYKALEQGQHVDVIYTDYGKAFDHVDHGILLDKLFFFGVTGKLLLLIESYLTGRTQQVKINGVLSAPQKVTSGVPQGSILGSLFFVIYVNDLPDCCSSSSPLLCADDAKFISIGATKMQFQLDLSRVAKWSERHKLPLNDKCKHLSFTSRGDEFYFNGMLIDETDWHRDLGLLISNDLKWDIHLKYAAQNALKVFFMIKRSSPSLPIATKIKLYKSMILRTLIHSSNCWSISNVKNMKVVENVQKKVLEWVTNCSDYEWNLRKCNLLPLSLYLQIQDVLFMAKIINGNYNCEINDFVCLRDTTRELRSTSRLEFEHGKPNRKICEQSFFYRTGSLINRLPSDVFYGQFDGLKSRLLCYFWTYFNERYKHHITETWKL